MEPRSAERGNHHGYGGPRRTFRASMEPRSAERGNRRATGARRAPRRRLQWSHAQLSVETAESPDFHETFISASMEPRSAERGNVINNPSLRLPDASFNGATLS